MPKAFEATSFCFFAKDKAESLTVPIAIGRVTPKEKLFFN
jgi:hypothetical protein